MLHVDQSFKCAYYFKHYSNFILILSHYQLLQCKKMKFSIKDFFSKHDQIRSLLRIWSHLLKKSLMENFIFCVVLMLKILCRSFYRTFQIE